MAKRTVKVKALVYIKYDKNCYGIGDILSIKINDLKPLLERNYIEEINDNQEDEFDEEIDEEVDNQEGE